MAIFQKCIKKKVIEKNQFCLRGIVRVPIGYNWPGYRKIKNFFSGPKFEKIEKKIFFWPFFGKKKIFFKKSSKIFFWEIMKDFWFWGREIISRAKCNFFPEKKSIFYREDWMKNLKKFFGKGSKMAIFFKRPKFSRTHKIKNIANCNKLFWRFVCPIIGYNRLTQLFLKIIQKNFLAKKQKKNFFFAKISPKKKFFSKIFWKIFFEDLKIFWFFLGKKSLNIIRNLFPAENFKNLSIVTFKISI